MPYVPINVTAYTAAYAGAIAGMATSGWITDQVPADYSNVTLIAGAFAQAFDIVWNSATNLYDLEIAAITSVVQTDFRGRGPGPFDNPKFQDPANWATSAGACAALILESDIFFAAQGINPGNSFFNDRVANAIRTATTIVRLASATAPTPGQALTAISSVLANWTTILAPNAANRLTPPDANTILRYTLNELAPPCVNTGTGGTLDMTVPAPRFPPPNQANPLTLNCRAIFATGMSTAYNNSCVDPALSTVNTAIGESADITLSIWAKFGNVPSTAPIFWKNYHNATYAAPHSSVGLWVNAGSTLQAIFTFGAAEVTATSTQQFLLGVPLLLSATYNSTTHDLLLYINGELVASNTNAPPIDWGQHGAWVLAGTPFGNLPGQGGAFTGLLDEARAEDIVRSQEYFREMYAQGIGMFL